MNHLGKVAALIVLWLIAGSGASLTAHSDVRLESFAPTDDIELFYFTIEPGDVSVLFYAAAEDPTDNVIIVELIGPNGETLYIANDDGDVTGEMFRDKLIIGRHEVAMYLPNASQFELEPGEYSVVVLTEYESKISEAGIIVRS